MSGRDPSDLPRQAAVGTPHVAVSVPVTALDTGLVDYCWHGRFPALSLVTEVVLQLAVGVRP